MVKLGVEGLGPGNVKKIVDAGYTSIPEVLAMSVEDLETVEGFGSKTAVKIYSSIHKQLEGVSLVKLMAATNIFGRGLGERKMEPILKKFPDILTADDSDALKIEKVRTVDGIAEKSASLFVDNIESFLNFLEEANLEYKLDESVIDNASSSTNTHELYGKKIVLTGFRDKGLAEFLKSIGADMPSSVSKNTNLVIIKSEDDKTGKSEQAEKLGIPIMTKVQFEQKYIV